MLSSAIIVFREVIEAGIIIGIVLAVTRGVHWRVPMVLAGLAIGVAGSLVVATFASGISAALAGAGQEIFNSLLLGTAVCMLIWHNVWMASHGRELACEMRQLGSEVVTGKRSLWALAIVIAIAVLREGSEVVLFMAGIAVSDTASAGELLAGGLTGFALGAGLSALTYWGLVTIPARYLFSLTSWLITFLAAGMAAQAVTFLAQAGIVTALGDIVWDTSAILPDSALLGRLLHALLGYVDQPTGLQLVAYLATVAIMVGLSHLIARPQQPKRLAAGV